MAVVMAEHFGGNVLLTNGSFVPGSPFREMLNEIQFSNFRYPGGSITEKQTWENGGLERMFGDPLPDDHPDRVVTVRELLMNAIKHEASVRIVIPTWQFFASETQSFDQAGFARYIEELRSAILDVPDAKITAFEIGNEFWAAFTPEEYGIIANHQIPALKELADEIAELQGDLPPGIGLQAGAQWRASGADESQKIASQIEMDNREAVTEIIQHFYPNAQRNTMQWQADWAMDPMRVFEDLPGFHDDLGKVITEFNTSREEGVKPLFGINQPGVWIEEFGRLIDEGVTAIDAWGLNYKWLTNKFYDAQMPWAETEGGTIVTKATPMGQVYDIAHNYLIGMETIADDKAVAGIDVPGHLHVTGFAGEGQRAIFLSNRDGGDASLDLSGLAGSHVTIYHLISASSPYLPDGANSKLHVDYPGEILDARGDMRVIAGPAVGEGFDLGSNEMVVIIVTDPEKGLFIEGAHNLTDRANGMVDDLIYGSAGNDDIHGHVGNDRLFGGAGDDSLYGGGGDDTLHGGKGDDWLEGGDGDDVILSGSGRDTLIGGAGNDILFGQGAYARIEGGDGDDRIIAAGEVVEAWGGQGKDTYFLFGDGELRIHDFDPASDRIGALDLFGGMDRLHASTWTTSDAGDNLGDLNIDIPGGGRITIVGGSLHADRVADFVQDLGHDRDDLVLLADEIEQDANWDDHDLSLDDPGPSLQGWLPPSISFDEGKDLPVPDGDDLEASDGDAGTWSDILSGGGAGTGARIASLGNITLTIDSRNGGRKTDGGTRHDDIIYAVTSGRTSEQIHIYGNGGNDIFHLDIGVPGSGIMQHGHHVFGMGGYNTYNFVKIAALRDTIVGRLDDFTASNDRIMIEGRQLDLSDPGAMTGFDVAIVSYLGQQWLEIRNAQGGRALYVLEGARQELQPNGRWADEAHFLKWNHDLPPYLPRVDWEDPMNFAPQALIDAYAIDEVINTSSSGDPTRITGTDRAESIVTGRGADHINGGAGNDIIDGGMGADTLLGGAGDDLIIGGKGHDLIYGGEGNDIIYGGSDRDTIHGGAGDDLIYGGSEDDRIFGDAGNDTIYGGPGNDYVHGGPGDDLIYGGSGDDTLEGGGGADTIHGGPGDDDLRGGGGDDLLYGGEGDDTLRGGAGQDTLYGGPGDDRLIGAGGDDWLFGGAGADVLLGGGGNDVLHGGEGDDTLRGNAGDDVLIGGLGRDLLIGGPGADRFVFLSAEDSGIRAADRDVIHDFSSQQGDRIDLSGMDADRRTSAMDSFTYLGSDNFTGAGAEVRHRAVGLHTLVEADLDGDRRADFAIMLRGVTDLSFDDFIL